RTAERRGLRFRGGIDDYRAELDKSIRCVERVPWLDRVVDYWIRWTRAPEFPVSGSPGERLEWAIRRNCREARDTKFFLSARDAATITGTSFRAANETLHKLVKAG